MAASCPSRSAQVSQKGTYSELDRGPCGGNCVKHKDVGVAVFALQTAVNKHVLLAGPKRLVMRNLPWSAPGSLDELPLNRVKGIPEQFLDAVDIDPPHSCDAAFLEVPAAVDVEAIQSAADATYYSSFPFLKMNAQWFERRSGSLPWRRTSIHNGSCRLGEHPVTDESTYRLFPFFFCALHVYRQ